MRDHPILFSAPMVQAILAGTKTQTRRVGKTQSASFIDLAVEYSLHAKKGKVAVATHLAYPRGTARHGICECPYGQPGDRLWVRENFADLRGTGIEHRPTPSSDIQRYAYAADTKPGSFADDARKEYGIRWKPSIHMPRAASRITLEITGVRVERLQDISPADCVAEGVQRLPLQEGELTHWYTANIDAGSALHSRSTIGAYHKLWESINGPDSWEANPWVWVVEFRRI